MSTDDELASAKSDWTPEERSLLAALARERIPPYDLKTRTVQAVRQLSVGTRPPRRSPQRVLAFTAAAGVIFVAGTLVGYLVASRATHAASAPNESLVAKHEAVANTRDETPNINQMRYVVWY